MSLYIIFFLSPVLFISNVCCTAPGVPCEEIQLSWSTLSDKISDANRITICDKRFRGGSIYKKVKKKYSQIDCYLNKETKELYLCRFHNLYGSYSAYAETFSLSAYCAIAKETRQYLQYPVELNDQLITLERLFRLWDINIDEINPPPMYSRSYINIIHQKIWYYDPNAIKMCSRFNNYQLQCLSVLSLAFEYQRLFNEARKDSIFYGSRFYKELLHTDWILPYFSEIYSGKVDNMEIEDGDEVYIKELRVNHRNATKHSLFASTIDTESGMKCEPKKSPILMDLMDATKSYWNERFSEDMKRDWLYLIDEQDSFEIFTKYGCAKSNYGYFESFDARNIALIDKRIVDRKCGGERCIDSVVNEWMINDGWNIDVVIVGNPTLLSYKMQQLLFQNINIFIGICDRMLSIALLCMERNSLIFDMKRGDREKIANIAAMTSKRYFEFEKLQDVIDVLDSFINVASCL